MMRAAPEADSIILDMNRVSFVSDSAARLLHEVRRLLFGTRGSARVLADPRKGCRSKARFGARLPRMIIAT